MVGNVYVGFTCYFHHQMYVQLGDGFFHDVFLWGKEANFYMGVGVFMKQHFQLRNVNAIMFVILRRTTDRNAVGIP